MSASPLPGPEAWSQAAPVPGDPRLRAQAAEAIYAYQQAIQAPQAALAQAQRLFAPGVRAMVTGQQPGLLTGPLYTLVKAVAALRVARLTDQAAPAVAVFWVASHDHDTRELDRVLILDAADELVQLQLPLPPGVAAGHLSVDPAWVDQLRTQLERRTRATPARALVGELIERCAQGTYAEWTARLLTQFLGPFGLIVVDPLAPGFPALAQPLLARELAEPWASAQAVRTGAQRLGTLGLPPLIHRHPAATNLFLEVAGQRLPLRFSRGRFQAGSQGWEPEELRSVLQAQPERFSPGVALRPLLQDQWLPTSIYVAGPGEQAYYQQLDEVYQHFGQAKPLIWPRPTVTLVEPFVRRLLAKHGLEPGSLPQALERLVAAPPVLEDARARLEALAAELAEALGALDPNLRGAVARSQARWLGQWQRLQHQTVAAIERRQSETAAQLRRLRHALFPGGPQERRLGGIHYLLRYGPSVLERLLAELPPTGHQVIAL